MQSEGPHNDERGKDAAGNANVVPFPRDWIGPREELIPFGPRAGRAQADEPQAPPAALPQAGSAGSPQAGSPLSPPRPEDFWSEGAAATHDAVQVPDPVWAEAAELHASGIARHAAAIGALWRVYRGGVAAAVVAGVLVLTAAVQVLPNLGGSQSMRRATTARAASRGTGSFFAVIRTRSIIDALRRIPQRLAPRKPPAAKPRPGQSVVPAAAASPVTSSVAAESYNPSTYAPTYVRSSSASSGSPRSSGAAGSGSGSVSSGSGAGAGEGSTSSAPASAASAAPAGPVGPGAPFGPGHLG